MKNLFILFFALLVFASCEKDDETTPVEPTEETASLKVMVEFVYGDEAFHLDSAYVTATEDTIRVSALQFFLSQVKLTGDNGVAFTEEPSYHLFTKVNGQMMAGFQIDDIPAVHYHMLHFGLGVDSEANTSLVHASEGDLDPSVSQGMLWSWNTGYKFLKYEGTSSSKEGAAGSFTYHVGNDENYKTVMEHQEMTLTGGQTHMVHFKLDVEQLLTNIDVVESPAAHGTGGATFMTNLVDAFMLHHFE